MIDFIYSKDDFFKERSKLRLIFKDGVDIVQNPFFSSFNVFLAFEFDKIYSEKFFKGLNAFLHRLDNNGFTFYTLVPSTDEYFFKNFSKYSISNIPISTQYDDYIDLLHRDPGESPADALLHNAETVALFSDDPAWGIIGSNDLEIGIVGFKDKNTRDNFLLLFEEGYFSDIKTRIQEIKELVKLNHESLETYLKLQINYNAI